MRNESGKMNDNLLNVLDPEGALMREIDGLRRELAFQTRECDALRAKLQSAHDALRKYGRHIAGCPSLQTYGGLPLNRPCDGWCGWSATLLEEIGSAESLK
jgi:hypothetical protein